MVLLHTSRDLLSTAGWLGWLCVLHVRGCTVLELGKDGCRATGDGDVRRYVCTSSIQFPVYNTTFMIL